MSSTVSPKKKEINLLGLDYFTADDAAFYCRVSRSKFYEARDKYGILPFPLMGKWLYRKADLQTIIERVAQEWHQSDKTSMERGT